MFYSRFEPTDICAKSIENSAEFQFSNQLGCIYSICWFDLSRGSFIMMKNLIWYLKYLNIHLHYMKIPIEDCLGNYIQYIIWFLPRVDNLRNGSFFLPPL